MTRSAPTEEVRPVPDGPDPTRAPRTGEEGGDLAAAALGDHIGWIRAILSGGVIVGVSFAAVVLVPNALLTSSLLSSRDARGVAASVAAVVLVVVIAIVLRRLQARRLI